MAANLGESGAQSYHLSMLKELSVVTDADLAKLGSCKNDIERFKLVYALPFVQKSRLTSVQKNFRPKSVTEARKNRLKGNQAFQKKNFPEALKFYNAAAILAPHGEEGETEYALALANRSAALVSMDNFLPALEDIEEAICSGYPEDLQYKLVERQAKCLLQTNMPLAAIQACQTALRKTSLLELTQRKKVEPSINRLLVQAQEMSNTSDPTQADPLEEAGEKRVYPKVVEGENLALPNASSKIAIDQSLEAGRFVVADSPIDIGDILVVEKAYASVIRPENYESHCHHCYSLLKIPVPCPKCSGIVFCSRSCRQAALLHYHSTECSIIGFLDSTGFGLTFSLALRMITVHPVDFHLKLKSFLDEATGKDEHLTKEQLKYVAVYNLLTHSDIRSIDSIFDACMKAVILLKCLCLNGYFGIKQTDNSPLSNNEQWIGSLLLRHIFILQVNGHEICEMEVYTPSSFESISIGAAIYPTMALFNHSCDPSVTRYFMGDTTVVRTIKPIAKGEKVEDNYGPFFTKTVRERRRKTLKERYWFQCMCTPCTENWPLYSQMSEVTLRSCCPVVKCGKPLELELNTSMAKMMCRYCHTAMEEAGVIQNYMEGVKSIMVQATNLFGNSQYDAAVELFSQALLTLDKILRPPNKLYLECQEGIRKCFWMCGNVHRTTLYTVA